MTVFGIDGTVRHYAWGSPSAIPKLLGIAEDGRPAAELWFGAHPDDPSAVAGGDATLDAVIAADPVAALGPRAVSEFGPQLPFLLKVLAADHALSLQVHPTRAEAAAGFAAEDAAGVPRDAPTRNYRDANHKPELLCALTPFDALCGFRPLPVIRDVLAALALPSLEFVTLALEAASPLRSAFTAILEHPDIDSVSREVGARAADRGETLHGVALAATDYPGDAGVVLALLLNYVRLDPGQAIFLRAGTVHAYLRGTGVEIMANSDNVLRCGLTPKHVDVAELVAITDFEPLLQPLLLAEHGVFDVPVPDFRLTTFDVDAPVSLHDTGPTIVLCTSGAVRVAGVLVRPGHAAFVPAGEAARISGAGKVFVAGVGVGEERPSPS